jgi:UDPglucose 6-dehydrogenase
MPLLQAVIETNAAQPGRTVALLRSAFPQLRGLRVAVLGLAFKEDTDDVRESPALPIVLELLAAGVQLTAYDPVAADGARALLPAGQVAFAPDLESAIDGQDALMVLTRWREFERIPQLLAGRTLQPLVIDGRRMLPRDSVARYAGIGAA